MLVTLIKDHGTHKAGEHVTLILSEAKQLINSDIAKAYEG